MEVHKIKTKGYCYKYYRVDNIVYSKAYLLKNEPYLLKLAKEAIRFQKAKTKEIMQYTAFPDNETMLKMVEEQAKVIFQKLNLKNIRHKDSDVVVAALLTDYFVRNHMEYNMSTEEDRILSLSAFKKVLKSSKHIAENHPKASELLEKFKYIRNRETLVSIFNPIDRKKGVCMEFSQAFGFLMEMLYLGKSLQMYYFSTGKKTSGHVVNLLEKEDVFYIIDVTNCIASYGDIFSNSNNDTLKYFMIPKSKILKENSKVEYITIMGNSKRLYHSFALEAIMKDKTRDEIVSKLAEENPYQDAIDYARYMIEHNYEIPNQEEKMER